ncbi:polysaccharide pyruvyl transferase family protein [Pseudorhodoferax sp.]|uniref:polysaccharide pyruvyl transferase family protein n=1 Tax=Pseudorhodoferax sp. TaxID=1993553 RepID=UPI0039E21534
MQLFYYKDSAGNFGDDLNPWIWYSLYPELFDGLSRDYILGIGTLINDRAPRDERIHVCGSGVGYHGAAPVDARWNFVFVRGPRSAAALGLQPDKAITDPAILVRQLMPKRPRTTASVAYMPHHDSLWRADWRMICKRLGLVFLDPGEDIHTTIQKICQSKFVIAEAMHAAIVADALRVPWVPVKAYRHILDFKWCDWAESLDMVYQPLELAELWDAEQFRSERDVLKSNLKRRLMRMGMSGRGWTPPLPENTSRQALEPLLAQLADCRDRATPLLSQDAVHAEALRRTMQALDDFVRSQTPSQS